MLSGLTAGAGVYAHVIGAGAGLNLVAGNGSYALTGAAAGVTKSAALLTLTAGGGSYAITGAAASVVKTVGWTTTFSATLGADSTGWSGFNIREVIDASIISTSGSSVRLTLQAAAATSGCSIDGLYIGHPAGSGDPYDFDGSQVQVLVTGSPSFTIAMGASVVTDPVTFALDQTKHLIIAAHFNATSSVRAQPLAGTTLHFKSAANETATANVTGYTTTGSALRLINKVEVM